MNKTKAAGHKVFTIYEDKYYTKSYINQNTKQNGDYFYAHLADRGL
jgi:hypothetical protein